MKRKDPPSKAQSAAKRSRQEVPEYHETPMLKDDSGNDIWPAPEDQMRTARDIIIECAKAGKKTIIVPDKDADGLTSGVILHRTLELLGLPSDMTVVHLLKKGNNVHSEEERQAMTAHAPSYVFVLDQGSRASPPVVDCPHTALVIDHHYSTPTDFPQDAHFVTACHTPPVATASLLTYTICQSLHPSVSSRCDWLAVVGTHGDLGTTLKWSPPFPDMTATLKTYTKKALNDVVSAINAPRRTATYDVASAWTALHTADHPKDVLKHARLAAARAEVAAEVERCTHAAPSFSADGKVAVFRIASPAQVHPVIATRWAGHLNSRALEIVMVANEGYLEGKVNFSCRVARCARGREPGVDIIQSLRGYAALDAQSPNGEEGVEADGDENADGEKRKPLLERLGDNFARGHVQASGGIVDTDEFGELMRLMRVGEKSDAAKEKERRKKEQDGGTGTGDGRAGGAGAKKKAIDPGQKNTLASYFGKKGVAAV